MKIFASFLLLSAVGSAQDWVSYGGDPGGMRHSPLRQIDTTNVASLREAWTFDTGDVSDGSTLPSRTAFETTPLIIDGVLYLTTPFCRVIALDPETGRQLWAFDPQIDKTVRMNLLVNRGVSYWTDGKQRRLLLGDLHGRLWSLDPATGKPDPAFGGANHGHLDLATSELAAFPGNQYRITSPPGVCKNTVITGALVSDGAPQGPSGDIRAFDIPTGREKWRFHVVPRDGEKGSETWQPTGSNTNRGGANAWAPFAVDEKLGLIFAPTTSPSYDFYGGDRRGANLYGNSVLALDCETGARRWHFQTVHHDIWDYDLPAQPTLVTVRRNGREVAGVAQVTKMGFVFLLDRLTGRPLFEVVEKKFPPSAIDGEQSWPTQPIPVKPPPVARQAMRADEVTNVTPESHDECTALLKGVKTGTSIYDPLGKTPQVLFPGLNGGTNWGGASFDPATQTLFVNTMDVGGVFRLVPRGPESKIPFALRGIGPEFFWDSHRYPCQQPPWGSLYAIDLNTGAIRWRSTLGEFDELTARGVPPTGAPNIGGSIVTAGGLIFIAATNDRKFRAFDSATGKQIWVTSLPASGMATPATYLGSKTGRQFVVIAAGGGNKYDSAYSGKIVAYALPQ